MNANSLLEAPSFRVGNPQFTESIENELDPDDEFFDKYPQKPEYRKNWKSINWKK